MQSKKGSHEYSAINEQDLEESPKMTKIKALNILNLPKTATLEEITQKYQQENQSFIDNPLASNTKSAEQIAAMTDAMLFLTASMQNKPQSPIGRIIARQHKKGRKALKAFAELHTPYFAELHALLNAYDAAAKELLSDVIGKNMTQKYQKYEQNITELNRKFKKTAPILDHTIVDEWQKSMLAENWHQDQERIKNSGGPLALAQKELVRLSGNKDDIVKKITDIQREFSQLETLVVEINEKYSDLLLQAQSQSEISAIAKNYKAELRETIVSPLQKTLGNDKHTQEIIKLLLNDMVLDMDYLGSLHVKHQNFLAKLESSEDPRIQNFLNQYDVLSKTLAEVIEVYPEFQDKLSNFSTALYQLGAQFLLELQNPKADIETLTKILNQHLESYIININKDFHNNDHQAFSTTDANWAAAWTKLSPQVWDLYADIHIEKAVIADPLGLFQDQYNTYLGNIEAIKDTQVIPEHKAVLEKLGQDILNIGQTYFNGLKEEDADIEALSRAYQTDLNHTLQSAESSFEQAGVDKSEVWPKLNIVVQILATLVYFVKWYIQNEDAKIPERNRTFRAEKTSFKDTLPQWLDGIPKLNEERYAEHKARIRKD